MDLLKFIVFDILGVTPLLVGFIALIGLLIQRKPIEKVLSGTFKTIVGFLVFAGRAGIAVTSLGNFQTLFSDGFGLKGVMPLAEALTGLAQTKFAMCVSLIMVVGFGWNLFFARVTPFKYIFLTGQHNLYLSALLTVTLKALGYSDVRQQSSSVPYCWGLRPVSIQLLLSGGCVRLPVMMKLLMVILRYSGLRAIGRSVRKWAILSSQQKS